MYEDGPGMAVPRDESRIKLAVEGLIGERQKLIDRVGEINSELRELRAMADHALEGNRTIAHDSESPTIRY